MDFQPWVALLALGALWLNGLLIAADALRRRAWIGRERGFPVLEEPRAGADAWIRVRSRGGGWARWEVEQRGRLDGGGRLSWHDRAYRSEIDGGEAEWAGQRVQVAPEERVEVWPDHASLRRRLAEGLDAEAWKRAAKGRGLIRTLTTDVGEGPIWVGGRWTRSEDGWTVSAPAPRPLLVAFLNPKAWMDRARAELLLFALATIAALGLLTVLCLWPPIFGPVSTAGGALALIYFLLIQPAGTWIRGRNVEPARRSVEGRVPASLNPNSSHR